MTLLTGEDFRNLFRTFAYTAFRLEVRESYYEKKELAQFLAGEYDVSYMDGWLSLIRSLRADGKRVERVRVVSKPYSDYTRYGLWLCQYNTQAGEDIRYLERDQAAGLPTYDYWLFDSRQLYIVHFADTDELLGAELIEDPAAVVQAGYWRDAAWHQATPYREYVKETDVRVEHPASA